MKLNKGIFIAIEGCDGCGKTTLIKGLEKKFEENDIDFVITREPGGGTVSEKIRNVILENEMTVETEALLFAASRLQSMYDIVNPAIDENKLVLSDRSIVASYAYQGFAKLLGRDNITSINFNKTCYPDLVIFIDIKPESCLKRIKENSRGTNRLDNEDLKIHKRRYYGYLSILSKFNHIKVDGKLSKDELCDYAYNKIIEYLKEGRYID